MAVISSITSVIDAYCQWETCVTKIALISIPVIDIRTYMAKSIEKQTANVSTFEAFSSLFISNFKLLLKLYYKRP